MFTQLSDFSETHFDSQNNITVYFTRLRDRVVSVSYDENHNVYIVCLNNPNFDPATDLDSPVWNYTSWDSPLLLDFCTESLETALETANRFLTKENLPTYHPEYLPTSDI